MHSFLEHLTIYLICSFCYVPPSPRFTVLFHTHLLFAIASQRLHDFIGACLRIAVGINAQLRRVVRRPEVRHVPITEIIAARVGD